MYGGATGSDNHYESLSEARNSYEKDMSDMTIPAVSKVDTMKKTPESLREQAKKARQHQWKLINTLKTAIGKPDKMEQSRWFILTQRAKTQGFRAAALEREAESLLSKEDQEAAQQIRDNKKAASEDSFENWKKEQERKNGPYNFHPDITDQTEPDVVSTISALSGVSDKDIKAKMFLKVQEGLSKTEAYRAIWEESEIRTDKPLTSIDLEVASPTDSSFVDKGPNSNIIEVGIVKRHLDGSIERHSFLNGVPEDFEKVYGTGAEHIHNISVDDIAGKQLFLDDVDNVNKMRDMLDGSVMVAHNAKYEIGQLQNNMFGFTSMLNTGRIEVLDTRTVCTYFLPQTSDNTNKSLVEASGNVYENAHRALNDAEMTLSALLSLKNPK